MIENLDLEKDAKNTKKRILTKGIPFAYFIWFWFFDLGFITGALVTYGF